MNYKFNILSSLLLLLIVFVSCDNSLKGDFNENQVPTTFLTVEKIDREGDFRLSSQINISWWGNDPDGYIVGYEYAINDTLEGDWTFTSRTDSTFILPIEEGLTIDDILFKVRAVDNNDARDPIGARLVFPIVNSSPSVSINRNETPPDTLFSIASFGWSINDLDGIGNISRTEVAINDTVNGWVSIPIPEEESRVFISLEIDNSSEGIVSAPVFIGRSFTRIQDLELPGIEVGAENKFYVRAIDNAGAVSNIDTLSWFVKKQNSRTLFLNDYSGNLSQNIASFHLNLLEQNGITPDLWIINDGEVTQEKVSLSDAFPTVLDPTLKKTLAKWDHIYWLSNDIDRNITYALEITDEFFANSGTMFVSIPMKGISQNDEVFNFLPIDSVGVLTGIQTNFLLNANTEIIPETGVSTVIPKVLVRRTGTYPIKPVSGAKTLYQADFLATTVIGFNQDYTGFESVGIENEEGNLIYFGLDLTNIDASNNLSDFIDDLLISRLNFKQ
ncbi:MAG: hypothetical protein BalsKO_24820 [Balneolaceae bacterium]